LGGFILLTSVDKAKYPFHPQTKKHIANLGVDIEDLASLDGVVKRAKERITATFEVQVNTGVQEPFRKTDVEIASFPVAALVLTTVEDKTLVERFALSEAQKAYNYLLNEKDEAILEIAKHFKWDINISNQPPFPFSIHFVNYISNASKGRLVHASEWKLVNRQLHKGQVYVTKREVCRLLQEEIRKYIESIVHEQSKERVTTRPQNIQTLTEEVRAKFMKVKPRLTEFDPLVKAEESEYPPCIKNLLNRTVKGQHLSHTERFTLVTYLIHQGVSIDEIINLFSNASDFREDKTRYQVEHLAGQRGSRQVYVTYNCSTLQTHGVCFNPDQICKTIGNPLTYHLRKKPKERDTKST
jgi:DNA primase large subunit